MATTNSTRSPPTTSTLAPTETLTPLVVKDGTTTNAAATEVDAGFIVALVCFAIGGVLLLAGFIKVLVWYIDSRKHEKYSKWWLRQLEHRRHLEEYSIRTGDAASHYSASVHSLANQGFTHEEEEDDFGRAEPPGSPVATATQAAEIADYANGQLAKMDGTAGGANRQDKNMNEIMDYL